MCNMYKNLHYKFTENMHKQQVYVNLLAIWLYVWLYASFLGKYELLLFCQPKLF